MGRRIVSFGLTCLALLSGFSAPAVSESQAAASARRTDVPADASRRPAAAPFILILDPGHGGRDAGSKGGGGALREKDFTLRAAKLLAGRFRGRTDIKVVLTREGDTEVTPVRRAAIANYNAAGLMISLHADASWRAGARGPAIMVAAPQRPPMVAGEPAEAVALRWQRGQNVHLAASRRFARRLRTRFNALVKEGEVPLRSLTLRSLEGAKLPAVYVSLGVISTPEEAARLREMRADDPYLVALEKEILQFARLPERTAGEDAAGEKGASEEKATESGGEGPAPAPKPEP